MRGPRPIPVLVVDGSYYSVVTAVRALRAAGYAPWLAVSEPGTYAARSRAKAGIVSVPDPSLDGEAFIRELAAAAVQLSAAAVLPTAEHHLLVLAGRDADFAGITLAVPPRESVERATNKALLPELAAHVGLRTPPTLKLARGDSMAMGTVDVPTFVKPLRSWIRNPDGTLSQYSAHRVPTDKIQQALDNFPNGEALIQPYVSGTLCSVSGVAWEGELICALHQDSLRVWPVLAGVSSYAKTVPPNVELEQAVSRLLQVIAWSGPFQVQFIRSPDGECYLLDLNPRIYGSLALAVGAGLNLPAIWVDLLLGRRPQVDGYHVGVHFRQEEKDMRALAWLLLAGGNQGWRALRGFVPRRGTVHAIASLRDPMPLLTSVARGTTHVASYIRDLMPRQASSGERPSFRD